MIIVYVLIALAVLLLIGVVLSVRIVKQYELAVIFRLGRVRDSARGPGLIVFDTNTGTVIERAITRGSEFSWERHRMVANLATYAVSLILVSVYR